MYFTFVPQKLSRQANLFYRKYQFQNDNSLLPFQSIDEKELIVRQSVDYRDLTELGRDTDKNYAIVYLRRSQFSEFIYRRYVKIDELLSFLGGFLQIMITSFGIIIMYYNKLSLQIELSNKLYNFPGQVLGKSKIKNNKVQQTLEGSMINDSKIIVNSEQGASKATLIFDKEDFSFQKSILKLFEQSQSLKLSLKSLIFQTLLFQKAMDTLDQNLDIQEILYQLQEISKLKLLMLTKNQIKLLNFTPKPNLTLEDEEQLPNRLLIEQKLSQQEIQIVNKEEIINELYNAWLEIKSDNSQNFCNQELNRRLNQVLGKEFQQIFLEYEKISNNQIQNAYEKPIQPQVLLQTLN
ncbi:unnamed protein product [Paramecium sonneborni]|nr:unnamed protein product [Paramecium sonneborni]